METIINTFKTNTWRDYTIIISLIILIIFSIYTIYQIKRDKYNWSKTIIFPIAVLCLGTELMGSKGYNENWEKAYRVDSLISEYRYDEAESLCNSLRDLPGKAGEHVRYAQEYINSDEYLYKAGKYFESKGEWIEAMKCYIDCYNYKDAEERFNICSKVRLYEQGVYLW